MSCEYNPSSHHLHTAYPEVLSSHSMHTVLRYSEYLAEVAERYINMKGNRVLNEYGVTFSP